jgi:hypothetical protein
LVEIRVQIWLSLIPENQHTDMAVELIHNFPECFELHHAPGAAEAAIAAGAEGALQVADIGGLYHYSRREVPHIYSFAE